MTLELPNNATNIEIMDFKKFAQSRKGLMFSEEKVFIKGVFREKGEKKTISGDNFWTNKVWKSGEKTNVELIYKTYLEWFNYTLRRNEKEREFVSAKFGEKLA